MDTQTTIVKPSRWHINGAAILNAIVLAGGYANVLPPKVGLIVTALATGAAAYIHNSAVSK